MTYPEFIAAYCQDIGFPNHGVWSPCVYCHVADMTKATKHKIIEGGWCIQYAHKSPNMPDALPNTVMQIYRRVRV